MTIAMEQPTHSSVDQSSTAAAAAGNTDAATIINQPQPQPQPSQQQAASISSIPSDPQSSSASTSSQMDVNGAACADTSSSSSDGAVASNEASTTAASANHPTPEESSAAAALASRPSNRVLQVGTDLAGVTPLRMSSLRSALQSIASNPIERDSIYGIDELRIKLSLEGYSKRFLNQHEAQVMELYKQYLKAIADMDLPTAVSNQAADATNAATASTTSNGVTTAASSTSSSNPSPAAHSHSSKRRRSSASVQSYAVDMDSPTRDDYNDEDNGKQESANSRSSTRAKRDRDSSPHKHVPARRMPPMTNEYATMDITAPANTLIVHDEDSDYEVDKEEPALSGANALLSQYSRKPPQFRTSTHKYHDAAPATFLDPQGVTRSITQSFLDRLHAQIVRIVDNITDVEIQELMSPSNWERCKNVVSVDAKSKTNGKLDALRYWIYTRLHNIRSARVHSAAQPLLEAANQGKLVKCEHSSNIC